MIFAIKKVGNRMNFLVDKRNRKNFIWTVVVVLLIVVVISCTVYINDYYHADSKAIAAFSPTNTVLKEVLDDNTIVYTPENAKTGFIFYPGGKVEYKAYTPLMEACASKGIMCVLVDMPLNLAVFDINAADGICEKYSSIKNWYIGGHSLGGSMAASYVGKNLDNFVGLILLGSYSTTDLSDTSLNVLSVYGSEDRVLNKKKYDQNKSNLPNDFTEVVIYGGCHAYFGMYGSQNGDGIPSISQEEQIELTADAILKLVKE